MGNKAQKHLREFSGVAEDFLANHGWQHARQLRMAGDFSARAYTRLIADAGAHVLLMQDPDPDKLVDFIKMQKLLFQHKVRVPHIYAVDTQAGMALVEDLGSNGMIDALKQGTDTEKLYYQAIDLLVGLHKNCQPSASQHFDVPFFDAARFLDQISLFLERYSLHVMGEAFSPSAFSDFKEIWQPLLAKACQQPVSLMLRDYHAHNIMVLDNGDLAAIDFQDGGIGPTSYDVISLLEDTRHKIDKPLQKRLLDHYIAAMDIKEKSTFQLSCAIMAVQRHMRVLAILAQRMRKQENQQYSVYFDNTWDLLQQHSDVPEIENVYRWLAHFVPKPCRKGWRP